MSAVFMVITGYTCISTMWFVVGNMMEAIVFLPQEQFGFVQCIGLSTV